MNWQHKPKAYKLIFQNGSSELVFNIRTSSLPPQADRLILLVLNSLFLGVAVCIHVLIRSYPCHYRLGLSEDVFSVSGACSIGPNVQYLFLSRVTLVVSLSCYLAPQYFNESMCYG